MKISTCKSGLSAIDDKAWCSPGRLLLCALLIALPLTAGAGGNYQMKTLFNPGQPLLQAEARGRITIYDGVEEKVVERALDEQFDRIEHMMFTRVRHADPDGAVTVVDDGC